MANLRPTLWNRLFPPAGPRVLRAGPAMRVIFYYPGEEGTFLDSVHVTLYENGIIHVSGRTEETTTHLQNCEVIWNYQTEKDARKSKVRLLNTKLNSLVNSKEIKAPAPGSADESD